MSDDLKLTIGNRTIAGWEAVRVTMGMEHCPNDFDISLTEAFPDEDEDQDLIVQGGDACTVSLGDDLVITGYVDKLMPSITPTTHTIRITGRGKCQDLVDCAAEWTNGQITGSSALQIAQKLAAPYGISVSAVTEDVGPPIPQMNLILGETPFELIERVCRFRGLLCYERPDGSLFLSQVSDQAAASGVAQGVNVEYAAAEYSMDQRFSEYQAYLQSVETFGDVDGMNGSGNLLATRYDTNVKRHRRMVLIAEAGGGGLELTSLRAQWEACRRFGRSHRLLVTVDSWRDSSGALWSPNTVIPVQLPKLKVPPSLTWIIGSVTFKRDGEGTTADLEIMPNVAFMPEPILLQPFLPDIGGP